MTESPPPRLVNLTQHDVVVYDDADEIVMRVPVSGAMARISERRMPRVPLASAAGPIPTVLVVNEERITGLPEPKPGVVYEVSRITAAACPRADVFFPLDDVRDAAGRILGCRALGQFEEGDRHAGGA